jgi:hypothetical protein
MHSAELPPAHRAVSTRRESTEEVNDELLTQARLELAARLRACAPELQQALFAQMRQQIADPVPDGDASLVVSLQAAITASVDCGLTEIEYGRPVSDSIPSPVLAHVSRAAQAGLSLTTALRHCVAGYTLAWSVVLEEVAQQDLPERQRFALLLQVSPVMGSVLARVQAEIAEAHSAEIARSARSREQRRDEIVHKLLADEPVDAGELAELDYEIHAWHVGLIATGEGAKRAVQRLEAELGCDALAIVCSDRLVWAWLGAERRLAFVDLGRLAADIACFLDVAIAVGEPARGLDGLRQTHREAYQALAVARCRPAGLTRYLDVAPEATVLQDEALAESLVERYLSPLESMKTDGQMARKALHALFDSEHNVSSAAHILKVHRSTLHRWRNEIEERLGCRLHEHQADIEIALRIEELKGGSKESLGASHDRVAATRSSNRASAL